VCDRRNEIELVFPTKKKSRSLCVLCMYIYEQKKDNI